MRFISNSIYALVACIRLDRSRVTFWTTKFSLGNRSLKHFDYKFKLGCSVGVPYLLWSPGGLGTLPPEYTSWINVGPFASVIDRVLR